MGSTDMPRRKRRRICSSTYFIQSR